MKNNSETGHAKNVANLEKLVAICLSFGEKYNPSIEAIQAATLQILLQRCLCCSYDSAGGGAAFIVSGRCYPYLSCMINRFRAQSL